MQRYKEIDYLKAFSSILVVFYHAILSARLYEGSLFYICAVIALEDVHVPLFLLLAGYLCHKQDVRTFYRKKLLRIGVPFLFMSAMKLLFNLFISQEYAHAANIPAQLYDAFVCGQLYWFCYCLLILFLVAPLFWDSPRRIWTLLAVLIVVNALLRYQNIVLPNVLQLHATLYHAPWFFAGMLLSRYREKLQKKNRKFPVLAGLGILILGGLAGYARFRRDIHDIYLIDLAIGAALMLLLYLLARLITSRVPGRLLRMIGTWSLQIMLLDSFFRVVLFALLGNVMGTGLFKVLLVTALDVFLCCIVCRIVQKIPVLSTLMGLRRKQFIDRNS